MRIQVLSPTVAERIAAGEVVERPASVVKELVENALDAQATEVAVTLQDGGRTLIEILDNGVGMERSDLSLCIQRHATSKIREMEDLSSLSTLGFRGEALPSVAAVSDLHIISRAKGSETAHELRVASGRLNEAARAEPVTFGHFLGFPHGTRMRSEGLFSQVPARLKFLKSASAEVAQVREWIERLSLSRPEVGFRLIHNDRTVLNLRPSQGENAFAERIRAVLSDGDDHPVVTAANEPDSPVRIRAYWVQGLSLPNTRKLIQFVNGRVLRDRLLQQAVLSPFRQALLPGQFPAVAVYIDMDPSDLDVNVHPTKTEVRFLDSGKMFRAVQKTVESLISTHGAPGYAASGTPGARTPGGFSRAQTAFWNASASSVPRPGEPYKTPFGTTSGATGAWSTGYSGGSSQAGMLSAREPFTGAATNPDMSADPVAVTADRTETETGTSHDHPLTHSAYSGCLFNTYLMFELGGELVLIDQHAAHERIRYEQLRAQLRKLDVIPRQDLLIPEPVRFDELERPAVEERLPLLDRLGFDAELFGEDTLLFRSVPAAWGAEGLRERLKNLVMKLLEREAPESDTDASIVDEPLFEALASEACHSAIRAGDRLEPEEARAVADQLFSCEHPWNCPHGRPTVVRVPRSRFEEWFQRRV